MEQPILIDKDITWDSERLELRLYMQEGYVTEQVVVRPDQVDIHLRNGSNSVRTHFALPVTVDNQRATLSRNKSVYGETIDIKARIAGKADQARQIEAQELAG